MTDEKMLKELEEEFNKEGLNEEVDVDLFEDEDIDDEEIDVFASRQASDIIFKNDVCAIDPYTAEEEYEAFTKLADAKKHKNEELYKALFDEICLHNMRLVSKIAAKFTGYTKSLSYQDLVIDGYLGLRKAVELFDVNRGYKFSTYATWWVRQSITRMICDTDDMIRLPVHVQEKLRKWKKENPNLDENATPEDKNLAIAYGFKNITSNDMAIGEEDDSDTSLVDMLASKEDIAEDFATKEDKKKVKELLLQSIDKFAKYLYMSSHGRSDIERTKDIMYSRFGFFGEVETLETIGERHHITRERVRQIEDKYFLYMRRINKKALRELCAYTDFCRNKYIDDPLTAYKKTQAKHEWAKREAEYQFTLHMNDEKDEVPADEK